MLAQSVGPALTKHMHELLDLMFAYGLSPSLHTALQQLGRDIPPLLPDIQGQQRPGLHHVFLRC
jgi:FKBP12-rapamycin complex-associated protein